MYKKHNIKYIYFNRQAFSDRNPIVHHIAVAD